MSLNTVYNSLCSAPHALDEVSLTKGKKVKNDLIELTRLVDFDFAGTDLHKTSELVDLQILPCNHCLPFRKSQGLFPRRLIEDPQ